MGNGGEGICGAAGSSGRGPPYFCCLSVDDLEAKCWCLDC